MNCIILDDEPHAIEVLKRYVEKTSSLTLKGTFRNPLNALSFLQKDPVELIFLDVNMPNLTGIQFLESLRNKPLIIFTTAYSSYAAQSYEWDAVDYLVKPIVLERFLKAVSKCYDRVHGKEQTQPLLPISGDLGTKVVLLKSGGQTHRLKMNDILFISKESNYLEVHTLQKKILIRANMGDVFTWLPRELFCRVHKSFVVGLQHIDTIEVHQIKINKIAIPIGVRYRDEFLKGLKSME